MDIFTKRFNEVILYDRVVQAVLANQIGISRQCISDYKSGKSFPTIQTLTLICRELEVSSDYLLGLSDNYEIEHAAPMGGSPSGDSLSSEERKLLDIYNSLSAEMKSTLWSLLSTWAPETFPRHTKKA